MCRALGKLGRDAVTFFCSLQRPSGKDSGAIPTLLPYPQHPYKRLLCIQHQLGWRMPVTTQKTDFHMVVPRRGPNNRLFLS